MGRLRRRTGHHRPGTACRRHGLLRPRTRNHGRTYYTTAWHTSQVGNLTDLEHALEELLLSRQYWTDAMLSLELLPLNPREETAFEDGLRLLLVEVMEQRGRVALLIYQTQQEQLAAYHRSRPDQQRGGETGLACYLARSRPASEKPETP